LHILVIEVALVVGVLSQLAAVFVFLFERHLAVNAASAGALHLPFFDPVNLILKACRSLQPPPVLCLPPLLMSLSHSGQAEALRANGVALSFVFDRGL
jgi:hypothetical protein